MNWDNGECPTSTPDNVIDCEAMISDQAREDRGRRYSRDDNVQDDNYHYEDLEETEALQTVSAGRTSSLV